MWTVGMAFYDHPNSHFPESLRVEFTVMSLLIHHPLVREVVVVDNNPIEGNPVKKLADKIGDRLRYVPMPSPQGTSPPRNRVFEEARGEYVACIDGHVLLFPGFFESLGDFYEKNGRDCPDLLHGPMAREAGVVAATHMNDQWRAEMWGTWGIAWVHPSGVLFSTLTRDNQSLEYVQIHENGAQSSLDYKVLGLPELSWAGHEAVLQQLGCRQPSDPFPIPGHGMGFFACRKDAWLPFHPDARGFGGEEMTTGVRYRQAGRKCWCVPGAVWWHHFRNPMENAQGKGGQPYRLTRWDKVRNYILEFTRLGLDTSVIREHFKGFPDSEWNQIASGRNWSSIGLRGINPKTIGPRPKDMPPDRSHAILSGCGGQTVAQLIQKGLDGLYENVVNNNSNVAEEAPFLKDLASSCGPDNGPGRVVELGTFNGLSAVALMAGKPKSLRTYENGRVRMAEYLQRVKPDGTEYKFVNAELPDEIPECDLLFLNTEPHNSDNVYRTLKKHHWRVSRYIAVHGTTVYGELWNNQPGVLPGVRGFLKSFPEWTSVRHHMTKSGLIVLSKDPRDKQQPPDLLRKSLNFGIALFQHAANGFTPTTKEEQSRRVEVCVLCDKRWHDVCGECGCPIEKKAGWKDETCPLGKW